MGKKIVILGAGFGGLRAAMVLGRKIGREHEVILIDKNPYHTYTPTLYEIATTSPEVANLIDLKSIVTFPIEEILGGLPIKFINAEITELDLKEGDIHLKSGEKLTWDYLVIALGSETNYFDIPGLKENSLDLKNFPEAIRIRDAVLDLLTKGRKELKIVIGGGGSTGVELAGELQEWLCESKNGKPLCYADISIIEATPTILGNLDKRVVEKATQRLEKLGVKILTGEIIEKVTKKEVSLKSGQKISFDILVWSGGVKANSITTGLPLKMEKRGRTEVMPEMFCLPETPDLKLFGRIYGLGDVVCVYDKEGRPMPQVARAAIDQGTVVAENIICDLMGKPTVQYKAQEYPYIIPVGGKYAIAKIGPLVISSFFGWLIKGLVELNYLISIMPVFKALKIWLKGLKIFIQNDRLG